MSILPSPKILLAAFGVISGKIGWLKKSQTTTMCLKKCLLCFFINLKQLELIFIFVDIQYPENPSF